MPDLQSELAKLAHAWDDHEDAIRTPNQTQPKQENNVASINTTTTPAPVVLPPGKAGAPIRNNVMRTCFDTVRQHPGKTAKELSELLSKQGFKTTSTTAVFAQLVRTGQAIKSDDSKLHPNPEVKAYRPITLPSARAVEKKARAVAKKAQVKAKAKGTGIAALKTVATPAATTATVTVAPETKGVSSIIIHRNWTPESVLDKLTLPQAKQLYAALKEYFA